MEVFTIAAANTKMLWLIALIPLSVLVLVGAILGASLNGARSSTFEVSSEGLRIRGDWYGRVIPANHLVPGTGEADRERGSGATSADDADPQPSRPLGRGVRRGHGVHRGPRSKRSSPRTGTRREGQA